jgi:outer membrane biosynthesis protein TonB
MRTGLTISGAGHAAVLLYCVVTFALGSHRSDSTETLPIDVISATEFSQITKGAKNAPPAEQPKPLVEKVAAAVPVEDPVAKLAQKEIKAAAEAPPPPPTPEAKPPEPKLKKPAQPPPDLIAEALKKEEDKKPEPKRAESKPPPPAPPKKPAQPEPPQFDPRKVEALLDKRVPQRVAAAGEELNRQVSLGLANGTASQLSQNEIGALRERLRRLWSPPAGIKDPRELTLEVVIRLNPDGTLSEPPAVLTSGSSPMFMAAADSARRAVIRGQPYTMLKPEHYELWKEVVVTFDPRFMSSD